jgi:uncharacterized protein (DUF302 family)
MMSGDQTASIAYTLPGDAAASFQGVRVATAPFTEVVWRLREAIEAADFWILQEIDPQMLLKRGGYLIAPVRQILFFQPRFMARILEADPAAAVEAPLKIAILELPGGTVQVRWINPAAAFARYGSTVLADLGQELSAACEQIVAATLQRNGASTA